MHTHYTTANDGTDYLGRLGSCLCPYGSCMMHIEYDTQTVTNTLARYGVKRRSPAYYRVRTVVRAAWMLSALPIAYLISLTH